LPPALAGTVERGREKGACRPLGSILFVRLGVVEHEQGDRVAALLAQGLHDERCSVGPRRPIARVGLDVARNAVPAIRGGKVGKPLAGLASGRQSLFVCALKNVNSKAIKITELVPLLPLMFWQ